MTRRAKPNDTIPPFLWREIFSFVPPAAILKLTYAHKDFVKIIPEIKWMQLVQSREKPVAIIPISVTSNPHKTSTASYHPKFWYNACRTMITAPDLRATNSMIGYYIRELSNLDIVPKYFHFIIFVKAGKHYVPDVSDLYKRSRFEFRVSRVSVDIIGEEGLRQDMSCNNSKEKTTLIGNLFSAYGVTLIQNVHLNFRSKICSKEKDSTITGPSDLTIDNCIISSPIDIRCYRHITVNRCEFIGSYAGADIKMDSSTSVQSGIAVSNCSFSMCQFPLHFYEEDTKGPTKKQRVCDQTKISITNCNFSGCHNVIECIIKNSTLLLQGNTFNNCSSIIFMNDSGTSVLDNNNILKPKGKIFSVNNLSEVIIRNGNRIDAPKRESIFEGYLHCFRVLNPTELHLSYNYIEKQELDQKCLEFLEKGKCTYGVTKRKNAHQLLWKCKICSFKGNGGICLTCVKSCHTGHELVTSYRPIDDNLAEIVGLNVTDCLRNAAVYLGGYCECQLLLKGGSKCLRK